MTPSAPPSPSTRPETRPRTEPSSGRVLLVSNRLPVTVRIEAGHLEVTPSSGGLAAALRQVHARPTTHWIGWTGDPGRLSPPEHARLAATLAERRMSPIALTAAEVTRYYDGFSNGVLWPLFHYMTDRLRRQITPDWNAYRLVNERFAAVTAELAQPGDQVWIHDYHLMLVPELLRRRCPDAAIGFFLHVPFPAAEVFRILPWREPLLRGLLAADIVGFQTPDYAQYFRHAAAQLVGADDQSEDLHFEDRRVVVAAYPIGIDAGDFARRAASDDVTELVVEWQRHMLGRRIALGVDRLDYTKGIPRRLLAIERFFERWPGWRGRLQFIQLAVPTRERGDEYIAFRREVHELVGRINGRFGTPEWAPIHFLHRSVSPTELSSLYRAADVMLVTSLRDGMNLVAKEYCASRVDDRGVLILSELAGAAAELREALLVNPYDLEATAAAIRRALEMPPIEQAARVRALRITVTANDVGRWADRLTQDLAAIVPETLVPRTTSEAANLLADELQQLRRAPRRVLLLDYDGTLVPFAPMPDLAFPDDALRDLLATLAADPACHVHILSGRSRESLDAWLGDLPIGLHGEHGFSSRWPGEPWSTAAITTGSREGLDAVEAVMLDIAARTPGSFVERKGVALDWHYRMAEPLLAARHLNLLRRQLHALIVPGLELLDGAKILEVRVRGIDKGAATRRIMAQEAASDADLGTLALGDDRTDEDMFAALGPAAITVRVGPGATRARHRVDGVGDVHALLRSIR